MRRAARSALAPGTLVLKPKLALPGKPLTPPLTFTSKQPLVVNGKPYRGKLRVLERREDAPGGRRASGSRRI